MKNTSTRYHWTSAQKSEMRRLYVDESHSLEDVAGAMGCTRETVRHHLLAAGVVLRGRGNQTLRARLKYSGERHHGWKGGRIRDHGYWRVLLPEHPHADREGYYPEHRHIIEQHLNRTNPSHPALDDGVLRKDWAVHHKNGEKGDNRLRNLEPMPKGMHHSWLHYQERIAELEREVSRLHALLAAGGIDS